MDEKERKLFTLMWQLLCRYQQLLGDTLPVFQQINGVLESGKTPSDEQVRSWRSDYRKFDQGLYELAALLESLRPIADPLFGFDA